MNWKLTAKKMDRMAGLAFGVVLLCMGCVGLLCMYGFLMALQSFLQKAF